MYYQRIIACFCVCEAIFKFILILYFLLHSLCEFNGLKVRFINNSDVNLNMKHKSLNIAAAYSYSKQISKKSQKIYSKYYSFITFN